MPRTVQSARGRRAFTVRFRDPSQNAGNRTIRELLSKDDECWQSSIFQSDASPNASDTESLKPLTRIQSTPKPAGTVYTPLAAAQDQFRLLEILPDPDGVNAPLRCKLHVCALSASIGTYHALSYSWVADDYNQQQDIVSEQPRIECDGVEMVISLNLSRALRRLRLADSSRIIWADAICINQSDLGERSQQVARMGDIFRSAHEVIVWLGPCDEPPLNVSHPPPTAELLDQVAKNAFEGVCSLVSTWGGATGIVNIHSKPYFRVQGSTEKLSCSESDQVSAESATWIDIMELYMNRWFSRLWVVQEIVLARRATVVWGSCEMSWQWIGLAAAIIRTNWDRIMPSNKRTSTTREDVPQGVMNAYFMYRISDSQPLLKPLTFSFSELLGLTKQFACQDKRDHIFGLLGLHTTDGVNHDIKPDYTLSLHDTHRRVTLAIMAKNPTSLAFLSHIQHDELPDSAGHPYPSWIPEWASVGPETLAPLNPHPSFSAGLPHPAEFKLINSDTLAVRGVIIDGGSIMSAERYFNARKWQDDHRYRHGREAYLEQLLQRKCYSMRDLERLAITLVAGKNWYGTPIDDRHQALADFAHALLEGAQLGWELEGGAFGTLEDSKDGEIKSERRKHPTTKSDDSITLEDLQELAKEGNGNHALDAVSIACTGRCLFTTESGMKGVGPLGLSPGDAVCVFYGAPTPFVIRKADNGGEREYYLLGECYIDELMNGQVLRRGKNSEGWIHLV
ncbi:heterokaryon incompatibility protein-domain-containing protein, partial [Cladorrhinum sp. PSN259]